MRPGSLTTLDAPAGAIPALADAVLAAASTVATARADLRDSSQLTWASGWGTDIAAAARASSAVTALLEGLAGLQAELLVLARLLGAAQDQLDAVEARLASAGGLRWEQAGPLAAVGGWLRSAAAVAERGCDAVLTLTAEEAVRALPPRVTPLLTSGLGRLLDDGPGDALRVDDPAGVATGAAGATSLAGWVDRLASVRATPGRIAVTDVGDDHWVVQLPGIHSLLPEEDPQDLLDAVRALGTGHSAYAGAVMVALGAAGVPPSAHLLLVGHSQGGIVATGLAADPALRARWDVSHVVAVGSPVSGRPVRAGTRLLEVDNDSDLVTGLDADPGRDGAGRTVLRFRREHGDVGRNHALGATYVPFLASPTVAADPRVRAFTTSAAGYLGGGAARTQVFAVRDRPTVVLAPAAPLPGGPPLLLPHGGGTRWLRGPVPA